MPRNYYDVDYQSNEPSFGELFGAGLGQGLEALAAHKFGQMQSRQHAHLTQQAYEGFGAPKNIARALSYSTPEVQKLYLESGAAAQWPKLRQQEMMQMQQPNPLQRNMRQLQQPQQAPIESQALRQRLGNALNPTGDERQEELLTKLRSPAQQKQALREKGFQIEEPPRPRQGEQYPTGAMTTIIAPQAKEVVEDVEEAPVQQRPQREQRRAPSIDQIAQNLAAKEAGEDIVPFAKPKKLNAEEQKMINKETEPAVKKITDDYQFAKFSEPRLNKMEELIKKGGLPISSIYKIVKGLEEHLTPERGAAGGAALGAYVGGPAGAAAGAVAGGAAGFLGPVLSQIQRTTSPNTEEFEKLSAEFLKGAKTVFGGRFTNEEMKAYLAMVPTLMQTDNGKLAVIENLKTFNKASKLNYKAMKQIIAENGGRRPANLEELIEERTQPQLDRLSDIFREDLAEAIA